MTWVIAFLVVALYIALTFHIACWLGGVLKSASGCTCTRHRICPWCLEGLRSERSES